MPTCKQCSDHFPNRIEIDGQQRNLQNRLYCLNCVPFGSRIGWKLAYYRKMGRQPAKSNTMGPECQCEDCGRKYTYAKESGHTLHRCNSCTTNIRRFSLKIKCIEYLGGKCIKCGYNRCGASMTFHHKDPKTKKFGISGNHSRSWESIRVELDKCVLLCNNCHGEHHAGLFDV